MHNDLLLRVDRVFFGFFLWFFWFGVFCWLKLNVLFRLGVSQCKLLVSEIRAKSILFACPTIKLK